MQQMQNEDNNMASMSERELHKQINAVAVDLQS